MGTDDQQYRVRVTDEYLAVLLDCLVEPEHIDKLVELVTGGLKGLHIAKIPEPGAIKEMIEKAAAGGPEVVNFKLVEGRAAVPPVDGRIEWAGEFFRAGFEINNETDVANYREHKAKPAVSEGDLLATIIPPVDGQDGIDVLGRKIFAGRPRHVRVRSGKGVRYDEEELRFYATTAGRVRYVLGLLSVDEVYTIKGNIGLGTGNIYHPGALVIDGDIETGSIVKADGDITVKGLVEFSDIETGGDLTVGTGITGFGTAPIKVAGNVQAKYILEAEIVAGQDIVIKNEIRHANVTTQGAIQMLSGRLVGGKAHARWAADLNQIGSEAAVPTILSVGETGERARKAMKKEREIGILQDQAAKIHETIDPLVKEGDKLSPKKSEIMAQLMEKLGQIEDAVQKCESELDELQGGSRPHVIVRGNLFPETRLCISEATLKVQSPVPGPVRAVTSRGTVHIQPWKIDRR